VLNLRRPCAAYRSWVTPTTFKLTLPGVFICPNLVTVVICEWKPCNWIENEIYENHTIYTYDDIIFPRHYWFGNKHFGDKCGNQWRRQKMKSKSEQRVSSSFTTSTSSIFCSRRPLWSRPYTYFCNFNVALHLHARVTLLILCQSLSLQLFFFFSLEFLAPKNLGFQHKRDT